MTVNDPCIEEPLRALLHKLRGKLIVVGSVARGVRWPKDLDLLCNLDSDVTRKAIQAGVAESKIPFESPFIGCWTFRRSGWMVEIISLHYGPSYRAVRRRATKQNLLGIEFLVAHPDDTPEVPKKKLGSWNEYPGRQ